MALAFFTVMLAVTAPVPKNAGADLWVGKTVFRINNTIYLYGKDDQGQEIRISPAYVSYRVVEDEGARVRVINNGKPAWFIKAEVLRAEEAIEHFSRLIQSEPENTSWRLYRGSAYREVGKIAEGIKDYDELIRRHPTGTVYWNNRASLKISDKQYDSAIADLTEALRLSPGYAIALRNRGWANLLKKNYDAAIPDLDKAIERDPTIATPYVYRGQCRERKGEFAAAAKDFEEAGRLEPLSAMALNARAWFLATAPEDKFRDGPEALKLVAKACDLTDWRTGSYLDTVAAAHAACGKFTDAVRYQEAALADKKFVEQSGPEARARLELYKQNKPYRQSPEKK